MMVSAIQTYAGNGEHLIAELRWLECLIRREVLKRRDGGAPGQPELFHGMFISDREVDRLVDGAAAEQKAGLAAEPDEADLLRSALDENTAASMDQGVPLALPHLARLFGLTPFEQHLIVIALAPELDGKFGTLYAYLQDDITRRRPSVDLAIRLLCATPEERLNALTVFGRQASLFRLRILSAAGRNDEPLRNRALAVDEPIVDFLLGTGSAIPEMAASLRLISTARSLGSLRWSPLLKRQLLDLTRNFVEDGMQRRGRLIFHFQGPSGTGKRTLAASICREIGVPLLRVDLREAVNRFDTFENGLRTLFRHGLLHQTALYLENFDHLAGDEDRSRAQRQSLSRAIGEMSWLSFIGTETFRTSADLFEGHHYAAIELPAPGLAERRQLWESMAAERIDEAVRFAPGIDWGDLATKFRNTPGDIEAALETAIGAARLQNPEDITVSSGDIHHGLHQLSNKKLSTVARKLSPRHRWTDIVLPPNALGQLRELCAHVKHRQTVFSDWGFDRKLSLGKGICALFCGPSGVGKTMAVEVVAHELQLEVFKIDLANVVSKYIGETEKNLAKVFEEAEASNSILFFDEADALFGKRSEVKDAHDRYANIEINYLLQRMEEFEGLVIMASNLRKNIDDGFFRRMQFVVEFPFPDVAHRYRIWKQHFPAEAPAADDIDFSCLATKFNLSGGNIKNVVVNAAFLAAEDGQPIGMQHVIRATRREYEKLGRLCTENDFAPSQAPVLKAGGSR
jgi:SpoVK/Ycf46/Vps4 family AAA+-type ATPase